MLGDVFLIILGLIWIVFAVVEDLKKREIANWLNFSLVVFALAFRFLYSLFGNSGYGFFYQGLIGFGIFFLLGNLLYYGKVFAGGDAKLMIALGAIIPLSESLFANLNLALLFLIFFLIAGALYGVGFSLYLGIKHKKEFKKEFIRQFNKNKKLSYLSLIFGIIFIVLSFFEIIILYIALMIFIFPYIYFSAKAIDESCMIKNVKPSVLTEGDWLYKDIKLSKGIIKAKWEGLSKKEIALLKKRNKNILIRQGIPFSPVFLISYVVLIYIVFSKKLYLF